MSKSNKQSFQIDLDEIAPDTFLIHNEKVRPVLKGEGVAQGHTFMLLTERRAGLLGRLRARGFNVRTLFSRLKRLPALPTPLALGEPIEREVPAKERWSIFDINELHWKDIDTVQEGNKTILRLPENQIVRRRRSRSGGSYFRVEATAKQKLNLIPLDPEKAVLHGYAQATKDSDIEVEAIAHEAGYELILSYILPSSYLELLKRTGTETAQGILFTEKHWPIALQALHQLNLRPEVGDREVHNPDIDPEYTPETEREFEDDEF